MAFGILKAGVRGESPSYQKIDVVLVGAALAATLAPSKTEGSGLRGAASSVAFGILKAGVRGESPSYQKIDVVLVGAALAATPCVIEDRRFGIAGGAFIRGLWDLEGRSSGRKPLLPKD